MVIDNPTMNFWIYIRSFFALPYLTNLKNLIVYLSLDRQNLKEGLIHYETFKSHVRLSYLAPTLDINIPDIKFIHCPVDSGKMDLDGACSKCKLCLNTDKQNHIYFKTK